MEAQSRTRSVSSASLIRSTGKSHRE